MNAINHHSSSFQHAKKRGFSLVEIVIVVVVIGLSSAIAFPIISSNEMKAKVCEADASLRSLRTQLMIYYSRHGEYPVAAEASSVIGAAWHDLDRDRLNGKYFTDASFQYVSEKGTDFTLICDAGGILASDRTINQSGVIRGGI